MGNYFYLIEPTEIDGVTWLVKRSGEDQGYFRCMIVHGDCFHSDFWVNTNTRERNPEALKALITNLVCTKVVPDELLFLIRANILNIAEKMNIG